MKPGGFHVTMFRLQRKRDGSMDHIPEEDWPSVGEAAHKVVREAKAAGIWIFGCGIERQQSTIVATDGVVTAGPVRETKADRRIFDHRGFFT